MKIFKQNSFYNSTANQPRRAMTKWFWRFSLKGVVGLSLCHEGSKILPIFRAALSPQTVSNVCRVCRAQGLKIWKIFERELQLDSPCFAMLCLAGLHNHETRDTIDFMFINILARQHRTTYFQSLKFKKLFLAEPLTFLTSI